MDGSEPQYALSNADETVALETLARVSATRWPIETEFELQKSGLGLDEYEVRSWRGWHHHVTMCLLAAAFLLTLQQQWGEQMPQVTRPQVYRIVRELLPRAHWSMAELLRWLEATQHRNEQAKQCHVRRRLARAAPLFEPPLLEPTIFGYSSL